MKLNWKMRPDCQCAFSPQHEARASLKQNPPKHMRAHVKFVVSSILTPLGASVLANVKV